MADRQGAVPEGATHGARTNGHDEAGAEALSAVLASHGDDLAAAVERTDELGDLLTTAVVVAASADEDDLDHVTDSTANFVAAADDLTTDEVAALAEQLGEDADSLSAALSVLTELEREGDLEAAVDALDTVLELQRADRLDDLVDLADTLGTLDIDADTAAGLDTLLSAVGTANRRAEPVGIVGVGRSLWQSDTRAGVGFALELLSALGRRARRR